jgi:outer membrane murein-binding lipoprotein Lpp
LQVKMEAASALERLDVLDRQIRGLQAEEGDLARRTGDTISPHASTSAAAHSNGFHSSYGSSSLGGPFSLGGGVSALGGGSGGSSGSKDPVAAAALADVRAKLQVLRAEREAMGREVAAEKEEADDRMKLK